MAQLPTNPADFTIATFLAWVRTKPADERYDFLDATKCAVAQFGRETDRGYLVDLGYIGTYSVPIWNAVISDGWTFGALAARLEALIPVTPSIWTSADAYMSERVRANA